MPNTCDLLVIGSGVAGRAAATICKKAGWSVTLAEARQVGGTCPLRGCDPKKVLVGAAEILDAARRMEGKGLQASTLQIDWPALMNHKRSFTEPMPAQLRQRMSQAGITMAPGTAAFRSEHRVSVDSTVWEARYILIATGAIPAPLPIEGSSHLLTSDQFLNLSHLPERIVFVGGGFISMEFAHLAARCGRQVIVLEYLDRPLQAFDEDLVQKIVDKSRILGIDLRTNVEVQRIAKRGPQYVVQAKSPQGQKEFSADIVVHGAGRTPATQELGLDAVGITTEKGAIRVNSYLQSHSHPHIYAAGDVAATPAPQLTRVAAYEGKLVAKNLLDGNKHQASYRGIPSVVFTIPALAAVGVSEQEAQRSDRPVEVRYEDMGKWFNTTRTGENTAAYKLLIDEASRQILGAHILAHEAGEIINLIALAMRLDLSVDQVKRVVLAYPTEGAILRYML